MKKFFTYPVFLVLFLSFIGMMGFGAIVEYNNDGGEKYQFLQKPVLFITEVPFTLQLMIKRKSISDDVLIPINDNIYENKKVFDKKLVTPPLENLILISRHDGDLGRSIVEIRDLNTFEVLHSYKPKIDEIYKKIDLSKDEFKYLKRDNGVNRFFMWHPSITNRGELIFQSSSPLIKIDFDSNIVWVNDEDIFHHSINLDDEENIYVPSQSKPYSKLLSNYIGSNNRSDKYNFDNDAIKILLAGRITGWKGHKLLLQAISSILKKTNHKFEIIFVGPDENHKLKTSLKNFANEHNLGKSLHFVGPRNDLNNFYSLADLVISASTDPEAFGRISVEAQAMGKFVIASNHGGSVETVKDGETGYLFENNNSEDLCEKIIDAISYEKHKSDKTSEACISHVREKYSKIKMCEETINFYEEVIN